jgi:hypothetical protein
MRGRRSFYVHAPPARWQTSQKNIPNSPANIAVPARAMVKASFSNSPISPSQPPCPAMKLWFFRGPAWRLFYGLWFFFPTVVTPLDKLAVAALSATGNLAVEALGFNPDIFAFAHHGIAPIIISYFPGHPANEFRGHSLSWNAGRGYTSCVSCSSIPSAPCSVA